MSELPLFLSLFWNYILGVGEVAFLDCICSINVVSSHGKYRIGIEMTTPPKPWPKRMPAEPQNLTGGHTQPAVSMSLASPLLFLSCLIQIILWVWGRQTCSLFNLGQIKNKLTSYFTIISPVPEVDSNAGQWLYLMCWDLARDPGDMMMW